MFDLNVLNLNYDYIIKNYFVYIYLLKEYVGYMYEIRCCFFWSFRLGL